MTPVVAASLDASILKKLYSFGRAPTAVIRSLVNSGPARRIQPYKTSQVRRRLNLLEKAGKVVRVDQYGSEIVWEIPR